MEDKHKLTVEEIGALRHFCYQNIFSLEHTAFQIMDKIDKNYEMIEKLHLMAHKLKEE